MNQLKVFRLFLIIAIAFVSTSLLAQNMAQYIPADAKMIFSMHPKNLNSKVDIKKLWEREFVSTSMMLAGMGVGEDEDAKLAFQVFSNPSEYGIDLMDNSYFYITPTEDGMFVNVLMKISDGQNFSSLIEKFSKGEAKVEKKGAYKTISDKEGGLAWNDNVALITVFTKETEVAGVASNRKSIDPTIFVDRLMSGKEKSIATNAKFKKAIMKPADMRMWMDAAYFQELSAAESGMGMNPMGNFMGGEGLISMDMNFNKGAIILGTDYFSSGEAASLMRSMTNVRINPRMLKYIDKDFLGYYSAGFNINQIVNLVKQSMGPMFNEDDIESGLNSMGLNWKKEELYNLFKGDVMVAVTGVKEVKRTVTDVDYDEDFNRIEKKRESTDPFPEFVMMMSYNDEGKLKELLDLGVEQSMVVKGKGNYVIELPTMSEQLTLSMKSGVLFISNDGELKGKRLKKGLKKKNRLTGEHLNRINSKATAFYFDMDKTLDAFESVLPTDKESVMVIDGLRKNIESIIMTADRGKGDTFKSSFEIHMPNKKANSLDQLFDYVNELFFGAMGGKNM